MGNCVQYSSSDHHVCIPTHMPHPNTYTHVMSHCIMLAVNGVLAYFTSLVLLVKVHLFLAKVHLCFSKGTLFLVKVHLLLAKVHLFLIILVTYMDNISQRCKKGWTHAKKSGHFFRNTTNSPILLSPWLHDRPAPKCMWNMTWNSYDINARKFSLKFLWCPWK